MNAFLNLAAMPILFTRRLVDVAFDWLGSLGLSALYVGVDLILSVRNPQKDQSPRALGWR